MKFLKSKREKEIEQHRRFMTFLQSDEGCRGLCTLLVDVQLKDCLEPTIDLKAKVAGYEQEIVEQTKLSMAGVVYDSLALDLHRLLRQEVKEFTRKKPVASDLSNCEIAAANQISIREVKRRRRCGVL